MCPYYSWLCAFFLSQIHLCCGSDSIAKASFSLSSLASKDTLQSTLKLNQSELHAPASFDTVTFVVDDLYHTLTDDATVDIKVHLEQANELSVPTPPTSGTSQRVHSPQPSPSKAPPTSAASGSKVAATPPHSSRSARRNLTRSFEEASLNTPSSKTTGE